MMLESKPWGSGCLGLLGHQWPPIIFLNAFSPKTAYSILYRAWLKLEIHPKPMYASYKNNFCYTKSD